MKITADDTGRQVGAVRGANVRAVLFPRPWPQRAHCRVWVDDFNTNNWGDIVPLPNVTFFGGPIVATNTDTVQFNGSTFDAGELKTAAALVGVSVDVCGTCTVTVDEHVRKIQHWDTSTSTWVDDEDQPRLDGPFVPFDPTNPAAQNGSTMNIVVADVINPDGHCDKRVFFIYMPKVEAIVVLGTVYGYWALHLKRQIVTQRILVKDSATGELRASISHSWELGFSPNDPSTPYVNFNAEN